MIATVYATRGIAGILTLENGKVTAQPSKDKGLKRILERHVINKAGERILPKDTVKWFKALPDTYHHPHLTIVLGPPASRKAKPSKSTKSIKVRRKK